jgi:hypothetical protein
MRRRKVRQEEGREDTIVIFSQRLGEKTKEMCIIHHAEG